MELYINGLNKLGLKGFFKDLSSMVGCRHMTVLGEHMSKILMQ